MNEATFAAAKADSLARAPAQPEITPREDFKDTLLWIPRLVTDAQGRAEVSLRYPDNLTTWVTTARAQTVQPRFGTETLNTLVTKDVIARLSLPTFLVRGDQTTLSGIVNNTLDQSVQGRAKLSTKGLTPLNETQGANQSGTLTGSGQSFQINAQGRQRFDQVVRASEVGNAELIFSAQTNKGSDALKLPLNVKPRGYAEQRFVSGSGSKATVFNVPAAVNPRTMRMDVTLTPSLLSAVAPALDYLVGYPYGCTEQTMSRFLPALLARQTQGKRTDPYLKSITEAGLARLEQFQHEDGGWNFWEHDESTLEMTAYVTGGLLRAKAVVAR